MSIPINPPRTPLVMADGRSVSPEWWKFFLWIQQMVGGSTSPFDDVWLMGAPYAARNDDPDNTLLAAPPHIHAEVTDDLSPPAHVPASMVSGAATLSRTNDTNVTLTLGGTPERALLADVSLTLGWSGTLAVARGGTGTTTSTGTGSVVLSASPTLTGTVTADAFALGMGEDLHWGGGYAGNDPLIVGNTNTLYFYPAGASTAASTLAPSGFDIGAGGLLIAASTVISSSRHHQLRSYTVAGLPSAATAGELIYVSNETGGAVPAFSDGSNWRRVTDRAVVS